MQHYFPYLQRFSSIKVLCIGDIMLDCFLYGKVERISPEAPVAIFQQKEEKYMLGGVGNVLNNITSLGAKVTFVGFIGDDSIGSQVESLLLPLQCHQDVIRVEGYSTTLKTRLIANQNHLLRLDKENVIAFGDDVYELMYEKIEAHLATADIVLLSDYAKGTFTEASTQRIIKLCQQYGKKVLIDPKGTQYGKYQGATLIKPNLKEFCEASQMELDPTETDFREKLLLGAKKIFSHCHIDHIIITLSEHGMALISRDDLETITQIPTEAKNVFDVSGAGDTSLSMLGVAIAADAPLADAMRMANIASGIVIGKLGTACVTQEEMREVIDEIAPNSLSDLQKNQLDPASAQLLAQRYRAEGKVVGFTNGCFDLMHLGHLHSFAEAKKHCDVLFVGVNSDSSVKRYKGEDRPIQDEQTRATLVAALGLVDHVCLFEQDTPHELIDQIRPDIIAKEGYAIKDWPEAAFVESYGGKAIILPRLEGYSTSNIITQL